VEVEGLRLVVRAVADLAHAEQDARVRGHARHQDVVPLQGHVQLAPRFVQRGDLVDDLGVVGHDLVQFFKSL